MFILFCVAGAIVGTVIWLFGSYLPAAEREKEPPPAFPPVTQTTADTFKP